MNTRILELIKEPHLLVQEDIQTLDEEIGKYPYMQSLRSLRLAGFHLFLPDRFREELSITAAFTTDKRALFQLINKDKAPESELVEKQEIQPPIPTSSLVAEEKPEEDPVNIDELRAFTIQPILEPFEIGKPDKPEPPLNTTAVEIPETEKINELEVENLPTENQPETDSQNIEAVDEKTNATRDLDAPILDKVLPITNETIFNEPPPSWQPLGVTQPTPDSYIEPNPELTTDQKVEPLDTALEPTQDSTKQETIENKTQDIKESNVNKFYNTWQNWLKPEASYRKSTKENLIENFIKNEPKLSRPKDTASDYNLVEKDDDISHLMTDTLASLYFKQKKWNKAQEAYGILLKRFPEKEENYQEILRNIKLILDKEN